MSDYLLIAMVPVALLIGGSIGAWRMGLDPRHDLGLQWPKASHALIALALFLLLAFASELLYQHWGLGEETGGWREKYGAGALAYRLAFVVLIFPIAEEFFFRGFLFGAMRKKVGETAAVVGSSAVFALLHLQYDWRGLVLVFADALFFGAVRSRTKSTLLAMVLHILGNSFAAWQRL